MPPGRIGRGLRAAQGQARAARGQAGRQGRGILPQQLQLPPEQQAFHLMLGRMGFSAQAINALADLGIDSMESLCDITEKDIPSMMKEIRRGNVFIRQTSQNYLQALCYWVMGQERLQLNYLPEDFNDIVMRETLLRYQHSLETPSKDLVKSPEMFKEKVKWRDFSEAFTTFLQQMKGQANFSLAYVIRDLDDADTINIDPADFDTIDAYEEAIVPFSGPQFDQDNNVVFDSLKSYVLGGPHWTWIQDFERRRDGQSAWKALKEHFEGPSNQLRLKASAYAAIKRAEYKGAKNVDYELYRRIHTQAHSDLARYGEPVPEAKKVKDFLDGITDSTLQTAKYTIASFSHLMGNFHDAANYIGNIIDMTKKNEFRHVGAVTGRGSGGRNKGHRAR